MRFSRSWTPELLKAFEQKLSQIITTPTFKLSVTLSNLNRFSDFLHFRKDLTK